MSGKLGSNINTDFKNLSEIDKKQVYSTHHIKLISILNNSADLNTESSNTTCWETFLVPIGWINTSHQAIEFSNKIFKKNYLEILEELVKIGSYKNDALQSIKKELLFYIKKVALDFNVFCNKFNVSNFDTVNDNKFIFTVRSD